MEEFDMGKFASDLIDCLKYIDDSLESIAEQLAENNDLYKRSHNMLTEEQKEARRIYRARMRDKGK